VIYTWYRTFDACYFMNLSAKFQTLSIMDLTFSSEDEWENELPLAQRIAMKMGQALPVHPTSLVQG
jgi:hypothetical protein